MSTASENPMSAGAVSLSLKDVRKSFGRTEIINGVSLDIVGQSPSEG